MASPGRAALLGYVSSSYSSLRRRSTLSATLSGDAEANDEETALLGSSSSSLTMARTEHLDGNEHVDSGASSRGISINSAAVAAAAVAASQRHASSTTNYSSSFMSGGMGSVGSLSVLDFEMYLNRHQSTTTSGTRTSEATAAANSRRQQPRMPYGYNNDADNDGDRDAHNDVDVDGAPAMYHGQVMMDDFIASPVKHAISYGSVPLEWSTDADAKDMNAAGAVSGASSSSGNKSGDASSMATAFNVVNMYVGLGLLSKPYALRLGGWLSLVFLAVFTGIFNYTGKLLVRCFDVAPHVQTFVGLGLAAGGPWGLWTVGVVSIADFFSAICMCLIIVWNSIRMLIEEYNEGAHHHQQSDDWWTLPAFTIMGCAVTPVMISCTLVMLPFLWIRCDRNTH